MELKDNECSECGKTFSRKFVLKRHYESIHGKKWVREGEILMDFISFSDFKTWKECEEKQTKSNYVKARGQAIRKNGDKVINYRCYRSGVYKAKGSGKKKLKPNEIVSKKIGTVCPAQIWVKVASTQVFVRYRPTHENHDPASEHVNSNTSNSKKKKRQIKRNNAKKKTVVSKINCVVNEGDAEGKSRIDQHKDKAVLSEINSVVNEGDTAGKSRLEQRKDEDVTSCENVVVLPETVPEQETLQFDEHFISNMENIIKEELIIEDDYMEEYDVEESEFNCQSQSDEVLNYIPFDVNLVGKEEVVVETSNSENEMNKIHFQCFSRREASQPRSKPENLSPAIHREQQLNRIKKKNHKK